MKIRFSNAVYKAMIKTAGFWYLITPQISKYWGGQLIYIGTRGLSIILDFRGINSIQDFADALSYPRVWKMFKLIRRN